jgi:hypothetical protein
MTFEEFFSKKRIDLAALQKAEPALYAEFRAHYELMGEKSFDHTKKFWFNNLRRQYHLAPQPKTDKVVMENHAAEQTITQTLADTTAPPPNVGFTPRFKAGMTKPAESAGENKAPETEKPAETPAAPKPGFTPRFKTGVTKPAEPSKEAKEEPKGEQAPAPSKPGFTPRFKAGVTKPASQSSDVKNPPPDESATATQEVNEAAEKKDQNPPFAQEKAAAQEMADATERTADQDTPDDQPTQNPSAEKSAYKPRFNMKNMKPKD